MRVEKLRLKNFRNIESAEIELSENLNIFYGRNAQGKTNLLEAVYLFSHGKSFRPGRDKDFVREGCDFSRTDMVYYSENMQINFSLEFYTDARKKLAVVAGQKLRRNSDIEGNFYTVLFAPDHLDLVKEGPSMRRDFLDTAICTLKPKYARAVADYEKIITHKNALLKDIYKYPTLINTLSVWNEKQANVGSYIIYMRNSYIKKLSEIAKKNHLEISKDSENIELKYMTFTDDVNIFDDQKKIKQALLEEIENNADDELRAGMSLVGAQRDDIEILINGKSAKIYASQGQQRSIVLSIKLAEGDLVLATTGEQPVMLLDDVMSELDRPRQTYILKKVTDRQVIITGCDKNNFRRCGGARFFNIKNGEIN